MKVGLIIPANIKYSPYVQYYIRVFEKLKVKYKTISWNKANIVENVDYSFGFECSDFDRKKILIGHYLFACYCKKIIKREEFDRLVIFTIAPVFFLGTSFLKKYKKKFVFDIRDDSPFRRKFGDKLKDICGMANSVVISSENFLQWTPSESILCHNADEGLIRKYYNLPVKLYANDQISIVFAGAMNEAEINIQIVSLLKNNPLYSLGFIGKLNSEKQKIIDYVNKNNINNVWFEGTYKKDEIVEKYRNSANLINIFRKKTTINKNALPNKLYDAVVSAIPLIVFEHNEAIAKYVKEFNLGIILQENDIKDLSFVIRKKMENFDYYIYSKGRREFLNKVLNDQQVFKDMLKTFVGFNKG